jgi:hypothetical protein
MTQSWTPPMSSVTGYEKAFIFSDQPFESILRSTGKVNLSRNLSLTIGQIQELVCEFSLKIPIHWKNLHSITH